MSIEKQIPEYHQSSVAMFLKCQRQYMFRYLMKIKLAPKAALTLGRAFDKGVNANFKQKIESKVDAPLELMIDTFADTFEKEGATTIWEDEKPGEQKDLGVKMLTTFYKEAAPKIQPKEIEAGFRIETEDGYAIGGTLDVVDEKNFIRDTKTSGKSYQEDFVENSIQATMYDFAHEVKTGEKPEGVIFDVVTKTKTPKYQEIKGKVSQNQREILFQNIKMMHEQINRGDFLYAPEEGWWCSKGWCGYWDICKGKK